MLDVAQTIFCESLSLEFQVPLKFSERLPKSSSIHGMRPLIDQSFAVKPSCYPPGKPYQTMDRARDTYETRVFLKGFADFGHIDVTSCRKAGGPHDPLGLSKAGLEVPEARSERQPGGAGKWRFPWGAI